MTNTQIPAWIHSLAIEGEEDLEVDEEELPPLID